MAIYIDGIEQGDVSIVTTSREQEVLLSEILNELKSLSDSFKIVIES